MTTSAPDPTKPVFALFFAVLLAANSGCSGSDTTAPEGTPTAVVTGPDVGYELAGVTLDGRESTDDGQIVSYHWRQIAGPELSLAGATTSQASFNVPMGTPIGVASFELEVTDDDGNTDVTQADVRIAQTAMALYLTGDPDGAGQELWRVDRLGNKQRVSQPAEAGIGISWYTMSPNREHVAIERDTTDGGTNDREIWVASMDGSTLRHVTNGAFVFQSRWLRWSPDSRYLGFVANESADALHQELYAVRTEDTVPVQLSKIGTTDDFNNVALANGDTLNMRNPDGIPDTAFAGQTEARGRVVRVAWSSTSALSFVANTHGSLRELYTVNPDGTGLLQRFDVYKDDDGIPGFDFDGPDADVGPDVSIAIVNNSPTWSPDGRTLAFAIAPFSSSDLGGHVYTVRDDETVPTLRLVQQLDDMPAPRYARRFEFSPAGDYLIIQADRDSDDVLELYSQNLTSGEVLKVGRADLDLFPVDGAADTGTDGDAGSISAWLDDKTFVFSGDLRRDGIWESYVGRVDSKPITPDDIVVLTDVFSVDWNDDGLPDFNSLDANSKPLSGWRSPYISGVSNGKTLLSATLDAQDTRTVYTVAPDGSNITPLYTVPQNTELDDLLMATDTHSIMIHYRTGPGSVDVYEALRLDNTTGETKLVIDLFADADGNGELDFDTDGDRWPNYMIQYAKCADDSCTSVIAAIQNVDYGDVRFILSDLTNGTITDLAAGTGISQFGLYSPISK